VSVFYRLGLFCARRRWLVIGAWAIALLVSVPLAPQVVGALRSGGFTLDDLEASRARKLLEDTLGTPQSAMVIILQSTTDARAGDPAFEEAVTQATAKVPAAAHVAALIPHTLDHRQVSADGKTVYEIVLLDLPPDDSPLGLAPVKDALTPTPGVTALLAGGPAFYGDIQTLSETDLRRSEFISLPLAALALLIVFGTVIGAGLPIATGGTAVVIALAVIYLAAQSTPLSIFVLNLATLMGLGLGVDYALLTTSRFREELDSRGLRHQEADASRQPDINDAVATTVATAGRAVFFSGLTVLLGLIGLMLFEFMVLRSVGIAGAIVVGLAVTSALTLLPAVLAALGPRVDRFAIRRLQPATERQEDGGWARLARRVMDRPLLFFLPTLLILLILGLPFLHVRFNAPDATILPPGVPSRQAYDVLARTFGEGEFAPLSLAIRTTGPATDPQNVAALYEYSRRIAADPRVTHIDSLVDVDPRLTLPQYQLIYAARGGPGDRYIAERLRLNTRDDVTAFTVFTPYGPNARAGQALVDDLRNPGSSLAPPAGMSVLVGGGAAEVRDVVARIAADFPRSALFIVVSTYLVLLLLLRSVVLPLKAIIVNALSITASFGALVWIFQDGNLSALLGFSPLGFVETTLPVILFCVLFGLSMDYEVFLLSRMKEVYDRTHDNREAVARGMERSGRIVTSAALIVVVVAGSFAFADIVLIKALGLGVAIAVALDATIVRALLVPATMRLLGDRNWWLPARLKKVLPPLVAGIFLIGCTANSAILANPTPARPAIPTPAPTKSIPPDPQPVSLPRDDAPHDRLSEWWYYTGHLLTDNGRKFGFEFVIFRAERGDFPVGWASHLALTDESGGKFTYDQRSQLGGFVDQRAADGFDLVIGGASPSDPPWQMSGANGSDRLSAQSSAFGIDLSLTDGRSAPVLHSGDGWIDYGVAGGSYYYSRPRTAATGTLTYEGTQLAVHGSAWFDHQWGDFITSGAGGWDWFALNLADGTDVMGYLIRAPDGSYPIAYATVAGPGQIEEVGASDFSITAIAKWTSSATGADYPAGWRLTVPGSGIDVTLMPTVADQELDTRASTGVVYWEGSQVVTDSATGAPAGDAYVELTGYFP
jgi:RND superfamily putative drug exporter